MRGNCKITFSGLNVNQLLNSLSTENITVYSIIRNKTDCTISVLSTSAIKTIDLLNKRCYNIKKVSYGGLFGAVSFAKKHFVLLISLVVFVVALFVLSNVCLKVEVYGDFSSQQVEMVLDELDIGLGTRLSSINKDVVENHLCNKLGALYAIVNNKSCVLYVTAYLPKTVDTPIDLNTKRDIVSAYNGIVMSVLCQQGTPLVQVGDVVTKGQVLIEGSRIFSDGMSQDVYAIGQIALQLSVTAFAPYTGTITITEPTGQTYENMGVFIFGKQYCKQPPFDNYVVDCKTTSLQPLNLVISKNTYYQMATVTKSATLEQCLPQLQQQAVQMAMQKCNFTVCQVLFESSSQGVKATLLGTVIIQ